MKIDASFVKTMDVDAGSHKIVAPVIRSGHSLGMAVVAEGGGKISVMPNAILQLFRS
ncbi:EAL domain-containing protein [Rhizobium sp. rho-13.1]|nr:EAL domain-containing protein [Rhizobium sp. L51/94]TQX88796.1 EAL domain-containing protein [Rhizobium sp. rho-13.1]TQY12780.1 EAL domain-containing protein [Rhizobium sp. rho-1.1]